MSSFRLCFFDEARRLRNVVDFPAQDEPQAISLAEAYAGRQEMELWCRGEVVKRYEAAPGCHESMGARKA